MFSDSAYDAKISALMERFPSFGSVGAAAYKSGLERSLKMDAILGYPSRKFRSVHVAGTNGKGSVCNMTAASLAAKGLVTGLYTSPHILDFRERIRIVSADGFRLVPKEWVYGFLEKHQADFDSLALSFFEICTAMCLEWFAEMEVDIAVIETGLGGRLDATNIITPEVSVITGIALDHTDILGNTRREIAGEKAGIIKKGIPVVIGSYDAETAPVFDEAAAACGSSIIYADKAFTGRLPLPEDTDLKGSYQVKNLRTAACALDLLGFEADPEVLAGTAARCGFHGRWEKVSDSPLTICDIGHNEDGLKYNFAQLEDMLRRGEASDLVLIYGSVRDKDFDAVLRMLPRQAHIFFAAADNPRAMDARTLLEHSNHPLAKACCSVGEALREAHSLCLTMEKPLLYIGGSTYIVSGALREMGILTVK